MAIPDVRIVHVSIGAPPERVYAYVADPENLPRWAPNFGHAIRRDGGGWTMHTADGPVGVRFAPRNELGVLDHWVTLPDTGEIHNPIRVVPNGAGSLLTFTVRAQEGWTNAQLAADAALVMADLERLRALIESAESSSSTEAQTGDRSDAPSA
jgi:uncharacterized protein YndB with AHSA1/START domain